MPASVPVAKRAFCRRSALRCAAALFALVLLCPCLVVPGVDAAVNTVQLEHIFFDTNGPVVPVVIKARCKGDGCPEIGQRRITIKNCAWVSLNERPLFAEETSGWFFLWEDAAHSKPVVPTEGDLRVKSSGARGYLAGFSAGSFSVLDD